jgi:hypothetical protein
MGFWRKGGANTIKLSPKWAERLKSTPETGMGYQVAMVVLKDGTCFDQVVIVEGRITQIWGYSNVPFIESDILTIVVTHEKWDFSQSPESERTLAKDWLRPEEDEAWQDL